ncbi:MAG: nitroreductase family protein [Promethearchaeia archaeon]
MNVKKAINLRRAYRSLEPVEISYEIINELAKSAQLAPSCFNNQPWRYIFVRDKEILKSIYGTLTKTNKWVELSSLIIAVYSDKKLDCVIRERNYYLFDTGIATGFIILRATELGLVAHPIAGFNEEAAKRVLGIPEEMRLITLIIIGKHSNELNNLLLDKQKRIEYQRPERKKIDEFISIDTHK